MGGRKKGSLNHIPRPAKEFFAALIDDPVVQRAMRKRAMQGNERVYKLAYEALHGKPKQALEHTGAQGGPIELSKIERVIVDGQKSED